MATTATKGPNINVLAGQKRERVGSVRAQEGMQTNHGQIQRVTPAGTIVTLGDDNLEHRFPRAKADGLSLTVSEARRFGYDGPGGREKVRRRGSDTNLV